MLEKIFGARDLVNEATSIIAENDFEVEVFSRGKSVVKIGKNEKTLLLSLAGIHRITLHEFELGRLTKDLTLDFFF